LNFSAANAAATELDQDKLPEHVAVIMDGNGRWAKKRLLNRIQGHEKGVEAVRAIVQTSREIGISHLTLYAFSTENWQRPKAEVHALMKLLKRFLEAEQEELMENNIRLNAIGEVDRLTDDVRESLTETMLLTKRNDAMTLHLALSYGSRSEIVRKARALVQKAMNQNLKPEDVTEELIASQMYTAGIPDPDVLIRTSGEMRISNFLLWQIAYTEIFITPTLWPDFGKEEYLEILKQYQMRDRRYGKIDT
jgi:undecaprenyl diphosphate synthase